MSSAVVVTNDQPPTQPGRGGFSILVQLGNNVSAQQVFRSGDQVEGTVVLQVDVDFVQCFGIDMCLISRESCQAEKVWYETERSFDETHLARKRAICNAEENSIVLRARMAEIANGGLSKGTYAFPFVFALPPGIAAKQGKPFAYSSYLILQYFLEAEVVYPRMNEAKVSHSIELTTEDGAELVSRSPYVLDRDIEFQHMAPMSGLRCVGFLFCIPCIGCYKCCCYCCCCRRNNAQVQVKVSNVNVVKGEKISVEFSCSMKLDEVRISLVEVVQPIFEPSAEPQRTTLCAGEVHKGGIRGGMHPSVAGSRNTAAYRPVGALGHLFSTTLVVPPTCHAYFHGRLATVSHEITFSLIHYRACTGGHHDIGVPVKVVGKAKDDGVTPAGGSVVVSGGHQGAGHQ
eukprot:gene37080-45007_t